MQQSQYMSFSNVLHCQSIVDLAMIVVAAVRYYKAADIDFFIARMGVKISHFPFRLQLECDGMEVKIFPLAV